MFELMDSYSQSAVIKVLGVGGGGGNAVSHMVNSGIEGVDFMCINTDAQGRAWEVIFDLPLALPLTLPTARAQWFRPGFLDPAGHPIFQSGVAVNADWQPVDAAGQPIYANLWAAGNLLAHADSLRTRSHEGLAVVTAAAAVAAILVRHRHAPASAGPVPA